MSRSGKRPVGIPKGVEVSVQRGVLRIKGPKGTLEQVIPSELTVAVEKGEVQVSSKGATGIANVHGLTRALINNMLVGVSQGFEKRLEVRGVGYRAAVTGRVLELWLGYTYPREEGSKLTPPTRMAIPEGIEVRTSNATYFEKGREEKMVVIHVSGIDPQRVGQFAADVRIVRPPEPYKGKGIRYEGEYVLRKEGKKAAK
jgi:large subunit ribosomal protein L6